MNISLAGKKIKGLLLIILINSLLSPAIYSIDKTSADSLQIREHNLNAEELLRGERLFYGLVYQPPDP